jgi:hypothetical protein
MKFPESNIFHTLPLDLLATRYFVTRFLPVTHLAKRHGQKGGPVLVLKQPSGGSRSFDEEQHAKHGKAPGRGALYLMQRVQKMRNPA